MMKKDSVVVSAAISDESKSKIQSIFAGLADVFFLTDQEEKSRQEMLSNADGVISFFFNREIREDEYKFLKGLQILQTISTGVDYLPFSRIPENVVIACNAGGWAYQIAEHAVAMIMALYRRFIPQYINMSNGDFKRNGYMLRNLKGKTLGVIGYGGIGRHTAHLLKPFDVKVMALNTSGKTDDDVDFVGTLQELDRVLENADILVLAVPLTRNTRGLIGRLELEKMKEDATIINVARAPLVDEKALYDHLKCHPDFLAGIDVWWEEPSWSDSDFHLNYPFFNLSNFLGSPHNSNFVKDAFVDAAVAAAENVRVFLEGGQVRGIIDRDDYVGQEVL